MHGKSCARGGGGALGVTTGVCEAAGWCHTRPMVTFCHQLVMLRIRVRGFVTVLAVPTMRWPRALTLVHVHVFMPILVVCHSLLAAWTLYRSRGGWGVGCSRSRRRPAYHNPSQHT
jgi:hypothetical protein